MNDIFKDEKHNLLFQTNIELIGTTLRLNLIFANEIVADEYFSKLEDMYRENQSITLTLRVPKNGG